MLSLPLPRHAEAPNPKLPTTSACLLRPRGRLLLGSSRCRAATKYQSAESPDASSLRLASVAAPSPPASVRPPDGGGLLLLLSVAASAVAISASFIFFSAIPSMLDCKRAAESLEKSFDLTREKLPESMASVRLVAKEIGALSVDLSDLSQELTKVVRSSLSIVHTADAQLRQLATSAQQASIPAMRHVNPASDCSAKAMDTLQIMSVKVAAINGGLHWPLQVFGIVAARDYLDRKRNIIFHRPRTDCQTITEDDCYLALEGPTHAIVVSYDPTYLEVSLKVKGATESDDKDLSALVVVFRAGACPQSVFPSRLSTLEINFDHIYRSVEATVFIRIIGGSWPDGFRGVFSAASSRDDTLQVKLLDFEDGGLPVDANGVITLTRRVVSAALQRNLKVSVMAFPINEGYAAKTSEAVLQPHRAGVSPPGVNLCIGSCSMEVRVAWSCFCCEW
ncbi:uncharacterized protein LOC125523099 [Triticum urartu]|uniref:uncharacterized protein LOC125523099 n=1 Tax=Triticum urartu TaxID=4572 RepID=UPI002044ABBC|nr:uncharacterized protein LOC125523099 [Triticum urartu]